MLPTANPPCPACGVHVEGHLPGPSLADHAVSAHGEVRPPIVMLAAAALAAAGVAALVVLLQQLGDLSDLGSGTYKIAYLLGFPLVSLVLALGLAGAGLMVWRGDQAARFVAIGVGAAAGLTILGEGYDKSLYTLMALLAAAGAVMVAIVTDVDGWLFGQFSTHHPRPPSAVAARLLLALGAVVCALLGLMYIVSGSDAGGDTTTGVISIAAAGALGFAVARLEDDDATDRYVASGGAAAAGLAALFAEELIVQSVAGAVLALCGVGVLWGAPDVARRFGTAGVPWLADRPATASGGAGSGTWNPSTGIGPVAPPPPPVGQPLGGGTLPAPVAPPTDPTAWDEPVAPRPPVRPASPSTGAPPRLPPPVAAVPGMPGAGVSPAPVPTWAAPEPIGATRSAGSTSVSANRVALLLRASGASVSGSDDRSIWLTVAGATIVLVAGGATQVLLEAADPERAARVADVILQNLQPEDPSFALHPATEPLPTEPPASGSQAAGWYADPFDAAGIRWWDGSSWTAEALPLG